MTRIRLPLSLAGSIWLGAHFVEHFDWGESDIKAVALVFLSIGTAAICIRIR
jgi:hypothetical protein